jgi:DNA-binding Xre family transcriptional regulator
MSGMVTLRVKEAAQKRGIQNAYQLQKELGLSPSKAAKLWKGEMDKIGLETINVLCNKLKCKPNQIFEFTPDMDE